MMCGLLKGSLSGQGGREGFDSSWRILRARAKGQRRPSGGESLSDGEK